MLTRGLFMQSELLDSHAERVREMALLSGEIAHELKNPLASIKGLAGLLQKNIVDDKGVERLSVLRREVERMQSILGDFLNFSRPLLPLAKVPVALNHLLDEVMALYEGLAHEQGITIVRQGPEQIRSCDPRKMKQVLINLLQNAIEASPRGTVIEMATLSDGTMEIRDRGIGVPTTLEGKIFEPGVSSKSEGSGLGLTIARALMRQHGGELTLRPREGGGTVVSLRLPDP
jgi:signal transduction histidine kinase